MFSDQAGAYPRGEGWQPCVVRDRRHFHRAISYRAGFYRDGGPAPGDTSMDTRDLSGPWISGVKGPDMGHGKDKASDAGNAGGADDAGNAGGASDAGNAGGAGGAGATLATAHHAVREEWLALHGEAPLDPLLPIVDAHHHLWDLPANRYLLDEYLADLTSGHRVLASVFVQSGTLTSGDGRDPLDGVRETAFAASLAREAAANAQAPQVAAAIIGTIDFARSGTVELLLDAHAEAGGGRFRGVRGATHWHADRTIHLLETRPHALKTEQALRIGRALAKRGLLLEVWVYHTQLAELYAFAKALPELQIVLDHAGTPLGCGPYAGQARAVWADWYAAMASLAGLPNVKVKLGGLGMRFSGFGFTSKARPPTSAELAAGWAPYLHACIALFGTGRCMFESNFPVDKSSFSYAVLWNAFKRITRDFSGEDRIDLFARTAARIYDLPIAI